MKLKTHKATAKRVKITKTGKLMRDQAATSHLLSHKTARTKVSLDVARTDVKKVKKLAPYLGK